MMGHSQRTYTIDRYGNAVCSATANYCNNTLAFSATSNQITNPGYTNDATGNLTQDGTGQGTHTFQWDAEGRIVSADRTSPA